MNFDFRLKWFLYNGNLERKQAEVVILTCNRFLFPVKNNCSWFRVLNLCIAYILYPSSTKWTKGHHNVSFFNPVYGSYASWIMLWIDCCFDKINACMMWLKDIIPGCTVFYFLPSTCLLHLLPFVNGRGNIIKSTHLYRRFNNPLTFIHFREWIFI